MVSKIFFFRCRWSLGDLSLARLGAIRSDSLNQIALQSKNMAATWSHEQEAQEQEEKGGKDRTAVSEAHVACDCVASDLATTVQTLPRACTLGLGGPISAGKTTLGRALQIACERAGIPCHFAPEVVNEGALKLYIDGQQLPDWFKTAVSSGETEALRYNRRFYDVEESSNDPSNVHHGVSRTVNAHANSFQILMLASCQHRVREASLFLTLQPKGLAVVDRTAWDNTVFEEANRCLYRSISDDDHAFYSLVRGSEPAFGVDALVYLDVTPDVTLKRILVRGSSAEASYQRTYVTYLHDIWFHRIVQNYTETRHRSLFDGSIIEEEKEGRAPFPIYIVPWNDFSNASIEAVMQRVADPNPKMPRVRFVDEVYFEAASDESLCHDKFKDWSVMHWMHDYASPKVSDEQRAAFKQRVVDLMSRGERIIFLF